MKHMLFFVILFAILLSACNVSPVSIGNERFNPVHLTIGVPYQDKIVVMGQNYYQFTTGAASNYTIALTNVNSWLQMVLYNRADYYGYPVACSPEDEVTPLSVDLNSTTTYFLVVTETAYSYYGDPIETDSFQLLITGP